MPPVHWRSALAVGLVAPGAEARVGGLACDSSFDDLWVTLHNFTFWVFVRSKPTASRRSSLPILHEHLARQLPNDTFHFQTQQGHRDSGAR